MKSYATLVEQENPADIDLKTEMELEEVEIGGVGVKKDEDGFEEEDDGRNAEEAIFAGFWLDGLEEEDDGRNADSFVT